MVIVSSILINKIQPYDTWSVFITSEKKFFCFIHFSRNGEDFEMPKLKKFKIFIVMPKNFLMTTDMTSVSI